MKYTPPATPIHIAASTQSEGTLIEIADSGPGFSPGEEERIWEKFDRGKTPGVRGAGFGLAICRAIVHAHGRTIAAANRPRGGAVFRIWLPRIGAQPEAPLNA